MSAASCVGWRLPPGITLRPIDDADLPFLSDLYASTRWEELAPVPWSEADKRRFLHQQHTLQHRHYQTHYADAEFLLLQRDGEPIGRIYVHRSPGEIRLMDIALLPTHRRRGLGAALIGELVAEADAAGLPVTLHVERDNPAQHLYARHQFQLEEEGEVYQKLRRDPHPQSVQD
jgi:ribosomal protein S18 acetylase RimI-like enzyme